MTRPDAKKWAGHTPGPWSARPVLPTEIKPGGIVEVDHGASPERWAIWRMPFDSPQGRVHRPVGEVFVVGQEWEAAEANSHLIAAAPSLAARVEELEAALTEIYADAMMIQVDARDRIRQIKTRAKAALEVSS